VSQFLHQAQDLFATARAAAGEDCNWSLVVGRDGGIQVVDGAAWGLESLREHHGARAVFRVERTGGEVRLEGTNGAERCRLQVDTPAAWARRALRDAPCYRLEA
jgi:hypothetical protein